MIAMTKTSLSLLVAFCAGWLMATPRAPASTLSYSPFESLCRWDQMPASDNIEDRRSEASPRVFMVKLNSRK